MIFRLFFQQFCSNLGNLPALWESFNDLDIQQSFLTAKTRAEGQTLKIEPECLWGFQPRCSLTCPRKHQDKGNPSYPLILVTYDSAGPSAAPPLSSFIHLPLYRFIFHIRAGVWGRVCADAVIVLEAVRRTSGFFLWILWPSLGCTHMVSRCSTHFFKKMMTMTIRHTCSNFYFKAVSEKYL